MGLMTGLALALTAAGTATSVVGQVKAGRAAKRAGELGREASEDAADLSDYNAAVADLQSADAIARGQDEELRFRTKVAGVIGSQRAGFAAGNIDVGFGTAVDVQEDAARLGELDALTIRTNAAREAWGYKIQGEDSRRRGQIQRKEGAMIEAGGRANQTAARWGATSTLLGTAGSLLEQKYGMGKRY